MATNIGKKIEDYASKNLQALKQEEAKTGKKFTKYDIALFMLSKGELNKSDFASWMNTSEGFASQTLSKQQSQALKQGNVWSFAGYGSGEESYLDSLTPFSQKSDIEKINLLYSPNHGLGIQSTANEKENRVKEINEDLSGSRKVNVKKDLQENKIKAHWESLPEVTASYTELMNSIKFKEMSEEEQVEFLLKTAGEKFNEAREKGDKRAMKEYLMQGIGLAFQKLDNETGITKFKDWAKERSGLNTLVDYIDSKVDNNSADLSVAERIWENVKGVGDFADSLAGTQGIAMIGAFMILGEAVAVSATSTLSEAAAAKVLTGFQALLSSYFGVEGGKLVYDGVVENLNASSKEEVRAAGQKLGSGAFMLYGAGKGAKQVYQNAKTMYQASQVQAANQQALADARKTLGLDENVELTEATLKAAKKAMALKAHPDKGGSVEAMQQVNAAYDLLKASLSSTAKTSSSASASSTVENSQNVTSNTPVRYTQAQQVNATKYSYNLMQQKPTISSTKDGTFIETYSVPEGTTISTPVGYKTVASGDIVVKTNNMLTIESMENIATPDVGARLAEFKNSNGEQILSPDAIHQLLNNREGIDGKPIENFQAKIEAVLSNPEEIKNLSMYKSKANGVWRAIQDPLASTVETNLLLFDPVAKARPETLLKPSKADNIAGQGISFKQSSGQPNYQATRVEWGNTVEETIALNKANGIDLELVKDPKTGEFFLGIKDVWSDGYHRVDRNSVVMHYGNYEPTPENYIAANPEWVKSHSNPDGTIKDCAVVANDNGCKILENSYVDEAGNKIDFATMKPGTKVHKDPNAVVNAVAYDSPRKLQTLEGPIETDVTMGDVDGNVYNNFKQLKKQIKKGQLVANESDPYSQRFIELVKNDQDAEAIQLLKDVTAQTSN